MPIHPNWSAASQFPIVVHSHLRWSFVWQRPQQTHSRLALGHDVLFVEEPEWGDGNRGSLQLSEPWPAVTVARPVLPEGNRGPAADKVVEALLREAVEGPLGRRFAGAVHWLYTPQMIGQVDAFPNPAAVVYDCMDELRRFAFAPPELGAREARLLERADVVFTGGHELFLAKSRLHPNVHAFGCGVDFAHFNAAAGSVEAAPDVLRVPGPRLGYVGVLDERLDWPLLAELAEADPSWSLVMVGPVVKVDPASLPRPANAFYMGMREYGALPPCLAAFDVCLMPFMLNEVTEFINPTKTLEYLATGKPVVSTPIRDVVQVFGDVVHLAPREAFVECVRTVLGGARLDPQAGLEMARSSSWECMVSRMEALVREALASRTTARVRAVTAPAIERRVMA